MMATPAMPTRSTSRPPSPWSDGAATHPEWPPPLPPPLFIPPNPKPPLPPLLLPPKPKPPLPPPLLPELPVSQGGQGSGIGGQVGALIELRDVERLDSVD